MRSILGPAYANVFDCPSEGPSSLIWLKMMTPEGGSLKPDFERLLTLDFDRLLSAHGSLLGAGAKESVAMAVRKAFPEN